MQQITAFLISIFLFAAAFAASASSMIDSSYRKNAKQDLNLIGRDIVNYTGIDSAGNIFINENTLYKEIKKLYYSGEIIGCIFVYHSKISVISDPIGAGTGSRYIDTGGMSDQNKVNIINGLLYSIIPDESRHFEINIALEDENDYMVKDFYNCLRDNTVFIIANERNKIIISGYVVNSNSYQQFSVEN